MCTKYHQVLQRGAEAEDMGEGLSWEGPTGSCFYSLNLEIMAQREPAQREVPQAWGQLRWDP